MQRVQALSCLRTRRTHRMAFGEPWRDPDWALPMALGELASAIGPALGLPSTNVWIHQHTIAPYFCSTLSAERLVLFMAGLMHVRRGPRRPVLALTPHEWFRSSPVLCDECLVESRAQNGFTHVPRVLLLPYLTRCPVHSVPLCRYPQWSIRDLGAPVTQFLLLGRREAGIGLSSLNLALLGREPGSVLREIDSSLRSHALITGGGSLRRAKLVELMHRRWSGGFEHPELDRLFADSSSVSKLLSPICGGRRALHPLVGALLLELLDGLPKCPQRPARCATKEGAVDPDRLHLEFSRNSTATQVAQTLNLSVTTVVTGALAAGIPVSLRPKKLSPQVRDRSKKLLSLGAAIQEVAADVGVSCESIYRVLKADPALQVIRQLTVQTEELARRRAAWKSTVAQNPRLTCVKLRILDNATYAYLYRHDRAWLRENLPGSTGKASPAEASQGARRTPQGADQALAHRMRATAAASAGPRARLTLSALLTAAGRTKLRLRSEATPIAAAVSQSAVETNSRYVARKLHLGICQLRRSERALEPWRVERQSGLRLSTIAKSSVGTQEAIKDYRAAALLRRPNGR
jgi:hypothetical protein